MKDDSIAYFLAPVFHLSSGNNVRSGKTKKGEGKKYVGKMGTSVRYKMKNWAAEEERNYEEDRGI